MAEDNRGLGQPLETDGDDDDRRGGQRSPSAQVDRHHSSRAGGTATSREDNDATRATIRRSRGQATILDLNREQQFKAADLAWARLIIGCRLPFTLSQHYLLHEYNKALLAAGRAWVPPSPYRTSVPLLKELRDIVDRDLERVRAHYPKGVTIICDGWSDRQMRALLNFLAVTMFGAVFLFALDAGGKRKTGEFIAQGVTKAIEMVGADNVVQVVMDNAGANRVAGRLLVETYPRLAYTNCAAH